MYETALRRKKTLASQKEYRNFQDFLLISLRLSKKVLEKSKFFKRKGKISAKNINSQNSQSYVQTSTSNIKQIVKIKKNFLGLSSKKIKEVYKVINKPRKDKPKINMIFKGLSKRQVLVPMSQADSTKLMVLSSKHVVNINKTLNDIKSNTMADFI